VTKGRMRISAHWRAKAQDARSCAAPERAAQADFWRRPADSRSELHDAKSDEPTDVAAPANSADR
jgi:hypothetical protein